MIREAQQPRVDQSLNLGPRQVVMHLRVSAQIRFGEFQERGRRLKPLFLDVDERTGELDQAFVEIPIRPLAVFEPKIFQDLMRLEEELSVETIEKRQVTGVSFAPAKRLRQRTHFAILATHALVLAPFVRRGNPEALMSRGNLAEREPGQPTINHDFPSANCFPFDKR
jgi:hypothetical protein